MSGRQHLDSVADAVAAGEAVDWHDVERGTTETRRRRPDPPAQDRLGHWGDTHRTQPPSGPTWWDRAVETECRRRAHHCHAAQLALAIVGAPAALCPGRLALTSSTSFDLRRRRRAWCCWPAVDVTAGFRCLGALVSHDQLGFRGIALMPPPGACPRRRDACRGAPSAATGSVSVADTVAFRSASSPPTPDDRRARRVASLFVRRLVREPSAVSVRMVNAVGWPRRFDHAGVVDGALRAVRP